MYIIVASHGSQITYLIQFNLLFALLGCAQKHISPRPARGQTHEQKTLPRKRADKKRAANTKKLPATMPSDAPSIITLSR
jgi:hypothetical protein